MELAWAEVGTAEIAGPEASPRILGYFRGAGRDDVLSDEVPWCAAFVANCLDGAGISLAGISNTDRLLARSYLRIGTAIDQPRVGAVVVLTRGSDPRSGHVGFVAGWTDSHVRVLGGNQANAVNEKLFPRAQVLGYRWPEAPATARQLADKGSRTAAAALRQQRDVAKIGGTNMAPPALPAKPPLPDLGSVADKLGAFKQQAETVQSFVDFAWGRLGWVVAIAAIYWLGRMAWDAWIIREARTDDHNTGANVARSGGEETTEVIDAVA
jgi:uncharacterized protein (TIGR02594 family)